MRVPILCYHAEHAGTPDYSTNDHIALAHDLALMASMDFSVVGLGAFFDAWLSGNPLPARTVVLSCDDGTDYDVTDRAHAARPDHIEQSFANILRSASHGQTQISMANFVIASPEARYQIEQQHPGQKVLRDDWWQAQHMAGVFEIGSHGLDHNAPGLTRNTHRTGQSGCFDCFDTQAECDVQIGLSQNLIAHKLGHVPRFFAYPWGQASGYLRDVYMPQHGPQLGLSAALSTQPEYVVAHTNRWWMPRFVCGSAWTSPQGLTEILLGATA